MALSRVSVGMPLDASVLDEERDRIVSYLKTKGYYTFNKRNISFVADTVSGSLDVSLTMMVEPYRTISGDMTSYPVYTISSVKYVLTTNADFSSGSGIYDSIRVQDDVYYYSNAGNDRIVIKPQILKSHSYIRAGARYNINQVSRTYSSMSRLSPLKYTNIQFSENNVSGTLDATVLMAANPKYSFSAEIEGTNTAGDFGAAALVSLTNRNLFGGAEKLTITLRGAFEAISKLPGYSGNSYLEYGVEANLDFPELLLPFVSVDFQRRSQATSQLRTMLNSQRRPEFDKMVFTFGWSYLGSIRRHSHRVDVLDINYLTVPWISPKFKEEYLDPIDSRHSILRYNYEDMLISRIGYSFYYSSAAGRTDRRFNTSLRLNVEESGNLMYGLSKWFGATQNGDGQYEVLGIAFAQYVRSDGSVTLNWKMDKWNSLLFHTEYGIAFPYANAEAVPFEKRFYAGGANCVRGWAVRELGPGCYRGDKTAVNYMIQAGDVKLAASLEYRTHLLWKINLALFMDAGNIWTIREYEEQPGGAFYFDRFYRQIGVSYGAGLRVDLNFLVLRLDFGQQLVNPAYETYPERYPAFRSVDYRSYAFHFAIGYPF